MTSHSLYDQSGTLTSGTHPFGGVPPFPIPLSVLGSDLVPHAVAGEVVPQSVPAPLPLLGDGAAFGFSRRLRSRIRGTTYRQLAIPATLGFLLLVPLQAFATWKLHASSQAASTERQRQVAERFGTLREAIRATPRSPPSGPAAWGGLLRESLRVVVSALAFAYAFGAVVDPGAQGAPDTRPGTA